MTKEQIINDMIKKANAMLENGWTRDAENELWNMASENNIFMCEHTTDGKTVDGFYIEDDYWIFEF